MGFTMILVIIVVAILIGAIVLAADGVKNKNQKKVIITAVSFCIIAALIWYVFINFITSM